MKKLNLELLASLKNTFAHMYYSGEYKLVKKARAVNDVLGKYLADNGVNASDVGSACPFAKVTKVSDYTVTLGASLKYKKKVENACKRNGIKDVTYHVETRDLGMFPLFGELLWCNSKDLETLYIRCYQTTKANPRFFVGDTEIKKAQVAQWAPNDDFKKLSGLEVTESVVGDEDDNIIYAQDDNGNLILDANGEPQTISLPPIRAVKLSNCKIIVKGLNLATDIFTDEEYTTEELMKLRDEYYARIAKEA